MAGFRNDRRIENFYATFPENSPSGMLHLTADEAIYVPPGDGPLTGGWMLVNTTPDTFTAALPTNLTVLGTGRCFLKVDTADFDTVSRGGTWYVYASTMRLAGNAHRCRAAAAGEDGRAIPHPDHATSDRVLLVLLGVSVILWNPNRHVDPQRGAVPGDRRRVLRLRAGVQGPGRRRLHLAAPGRLAARDDLRSAGGRLAGCDPYVIAPSEPEAAATGELVPSLTLPARTNLDAPHLAWHSPIPKFHTS